MRDGAAPTKPKVERNVAIDETKIGVGRERGRSGEGGSGEEGRARFGARLLVRQFAPAGARASARGVGASERPLISDV